MPIRVFGTEVPDIADQTLQPVIPDETEGFVQKDVQILLLKCQSIQRRQMAGGFHGHAVVADRSRFPDQGGGFFGVAGITHGEAFDEDLSADLLCHRPAVLPDGAAHRGVDPVHQVQVRRVLGRPAQAAPPEDGLVLNDVVAPGLADLGGGEVLGIMVIFHGPEEAEGAGNVVIRHDQRGPHLAVDIVIDIAEGLPDLFIGPAFNGAAQVYADQLAEDTGVYLLPQNIIADHRMPPGRVRCISGL